MSSPFKSIRCTQGHIHKVQLGGPLTDYPYPCTTAEMLRGVSKSQGQVNKCLQQPSPMIGSNIDQKQPPILQRRKGKQMDTTNSFHNDSRPTVVLIKDQVYSLNLSPLTMYDLQNMSPKNRPHVRYLNPIPLRTKAEQKEKEEQDEKLHHATKGEPKAKPSPLTQARHNLKDGANPEIEIKKLLGLKKLALKNKDKQECRRIRRALIKLGYKRYAEKSQEKE